MIRIREARLSDARAVLKVKKELSATPGVLVYEPSEASFEETRRFIDQATRGTGYFLVPEENRSLLGSRFSVLCVCGALADVSADRGGRAQRRRPWSWRAAYAGACAWACRLCGVRKVELLVRASNRRARRFYEECGFRVEGRLKQRIRLGLLLTIFQWHSFRVK
jgi:hypothetical protein